MKCRHLARNSGALAIRGHETERKTTRALRGNGSSKGPKRRFFKFRFFAELQVSFQFKLVEEDLRELGVVVLPGVQHDLLDSALAERLGDRPGLDELRAISDHRQHFHSGYTTQPAGR